MSDHTSDKSSETKPELHACSGITDDYVPQTRRDFLHLSATTLGAVGVGAAFLPFIRSMNPAADVRALASVDVNISKIEEGKTKTVMWQGKPVFIRHRPQTEIDMVRKVSLKDLKHPETDQERFPADPKWLVVVGVCTHLGCIPSKRMAMAPLPGAKGQTGGWHCPCHGSYYDPSARIRKGPAPKNLVVPEYQLLNNKTLLRIG